MADTLKLLVICAAFILPTVVFIRLKNKYIYQKNCRQYPGYDRDLTANEITWIDHLNQRVSDKMALLGLPAKTLILVVLIFIFLFATVIAYMVGLAHFRISKTPGALTIQGEPYTIIVAFLVSPILAVMPLMLAAKLGSEKTKAFFTLEFSKTREDSQQAPSFEWKLFVEHLVRRQTISTARPASQFDLEALIERRFTTLWQVRLRNFWGACIIIGLAFIFERHNYSRISNDYIELSPFTTLSSQIYTRADIVGVDRLCFLSQGTDGSPSPKVKLTYSFNFRDGKRLNLISGRTYFIKRRIARATYWQNRLDPSLIGEVKVTARQPIKPTKMSCLCVIKNHYKLDAKEADKIAELYGLSGHNKACTYSTIFH